MQPSLPIPVSTTASASPPQVVATSDNLISSDGRHRDATTSSRSMARKVAGVWLSYFLPGFHPWNHDDRALIKGALD